MQEIWSQVLPSTPWTRWSRIHWETFNKFPQFQAEIPGVKLIFPQSFGPSTLCGLKEPIRSLEDAQGVKLMAIGKTSVNSYDALGFVVVEKYPPEFFSTVEKGVVDAVALCRQAFFYEFGLAPYTKSITDIHIANTPFMCIMNEEKWNSLPGEVQEVFEDLGGEYAADIFDNAYYVATRTDGEKFMTEKYGTEFITLPPEELARWDELVKPLHEEFLADLEAKGLPAREAYEEYHRLAAEYAFK
jgi:TRAP-type C4-dicarboxylate transport system substrate-binding protein